MSSKSTSKGAKKYAEKKAKDLSIKKELINAVVKAKPKEKKPKTNPNGANQYLYDPRQKYCWELYVDPRSDTFGSARASAIKAGYTNGTANQITTEKWFIDKLRRLQMLGEAEDVLQEMVKMPVVKLEHTRKRFDADDDSDSPVEEYLVTDPALVRIKQDTAKYLTSTLGKNEGYSTRQDVVHTGKIKLTEDNPLLDDLFGDEKDL